MIPNVVGYNGFKSYGPGLFTPKPGQASLERDYYSNSNLQTLKDKNYTKNFNRFQSEYDAKVVKTVAPSDFSNPNKAVNPLCKLNIDTVNYEYTHHPEFVKYGRSIGFREATKRSTLQESGAATVEDTKKMTFTTAHWKPTNKDNDDTVQQTRFSRSQRPEWSYNRRAYTCERGFFKSEYTSHLGEYGHQPRKLIKDEDSELPKQKHDLVQGTTKVTKNMPGYTGFIPKVPWNEEAVKQSEADKTRQTIIKQNIVENYQLRVPGYCGYVPKSAVNDRGCLRQHCFSTDGEAF